MVTEHLRDLPNFLAYTVGFFHFLSVASWHRPFGRQSCRSPQNLKPLPSSRHLSWRSMEFQLKIIGVFWSRWPCCTPSFPRTSAGSKILAGLEPINRQMMYVHAFFIALTVFLMGILCFTSSPEITGTPLEEKWPGPCRFLGRRLLIQFFGYSPQPVAWKAFETTIHVVFAVFWAYLTAVFSAIVWAPPRRCHGEEALRRLTLYYQRGPSELAKHCPRWPCGFLSVGTLLKKAVKSMKKSRCSPATDVTLCRGAARRA